MIDLRKPLEGAPGLLLLLALLLFGAVIGVWLALLLSWVEMKDSLANFLGGVVGASLGAALAVIGSLYVYSLQQRDSIQGTLNVLLRRAVVLESDVLYLQMELEILGPPQDNLQGIRYATVLLRDAEVTLQGMPDTSAVTDVFEKLEPIKDQLEDLFRRLRTELATPSRLQPQEWVERYVEPANQARRSAKELVEFLSGYRKVSQHSKSKPKGIGASKR